MNAVETRANLGVRKQNGFDYLRVAALYAVGTITAGSRPRAQRIAALRET
jgi:hypothetical protein